MSRAYKMGSTLGTAQQQWWDSMTPEQRAEAKKKWERFRERNLASKHPYPSMYSTSQLRVRELGEKQIYRMWVFKDRKETDSI